MAEKQVSVRIKAEGGGALKAEFQSIGSEAQKSFGAIDRGARGGGQALQNVGFQVQDFAVQVAGGTDVSRAFAQQLPQLLSGLGLMGVLFGTVAAVAIPLFAAFGMGVDKAEALAKSINTLDEAMRALKSASEATEVNPGDLLGRFGGENIEQARQVLEIQRQIAAARAENALAQTSSNLTAVFGDFRDAIAIGEDAVTSTNRLYALADVADALGLEFEESVPQIEAVARALQAVSEAEGPQAQADAMAQLRAAILDAADAGGVLSEEALALLDSLTDAELAALGLASVDLAGPISAGADEASRLAGNLWDAAAAQQQFNRANMSYGKVGARGDPRQYLPGGPTAFDPSADVVKKADEMLNPRPTRGGRGGGGGGGGGVSQAEREAARIYDQTRTSAEKYAIELEKLNGLHKSGHLDTDTYNRAVKELGESLKKGKGLAEEAGSAISSALKEAFTDPQAALDGLWKKLAMMSVYRILGNLMPNIFGPNGFAPLYNANGNVFEGGTVTAFASGGVVSGATMFPMKGGMGVMGEAGPEAILPLSRIGGKLGVASAGGGGSNVMVEINNFSGERIEQSEGKGPNGEKIIRVAVGADLASGKHDGALRSRFGIPPNRVKR